VIDGATSSRDLCGQPDADSTFGVIAFCSFSDPLVVQTPYFRIVLAPFEGGGLVAVREDGRYLLVTDEELPASVFLEVRANIPAAYPELAGLTRPEELLGESPDGLQCEPTTIAGRAWVRCQASESPQSVSHYLMADGAVYSVVFAFNTSRADGEAIESMLNSLQPTKSDD